MVECGFYRGFCDFTMFFVGNFVMISVVRLERSVVGFSG
jgi:hypothetical protein